MFLGKQWEEWWAWFYQRGKKEKKKQKKPTNLTAFYDEIITPVDEGRAVTVAYLAFSKAVDMFPQHPCIQD